MQLALNLLRDAVDAQHRSRFLGDLVDTTSAKSFPAALVTALEQQLETGTEDGSEVLVTRADLDALRRRLLARTS
jgi:2-phospho-L-lactate guanylyltransferase (CobY/MobA/RfbA family)